MAARLSVALNLASYPAPLAPGALPTDRNYGIAGGNPTYRLPFRLAKVPEKREN